jgi:hypothetical protein
MRLDELQASALRIRDLYDELNQQERGRTWTREEFMLGFTGDVGDLAKLVMAQEGAREIPGGRAALSWKGTFAQSSTQQTARRKADLIIVSAAG